jgi:signal transduction histidine kinase
MLPLREWLKPPKSLLLILFLLTLVSVSSLGWFGFKLLEQDRMVQAQQRQERLEQAADRIAATLRGGLAETGEHLSAWLAAPPPPTKPDDGILLIGQDSAVAAYPAGSLLFYPTRAADPEAPAALFAGGESLEFLQAQPARAAEVYRHMAESNDPAVRAGALLRLARVLAKLGRRAECTAAYTRMAAITGVQVAGAPADLVARHALGDPALLEDLLHGRWRLTRGQLEFYSGGHLPVDRMAVAEAAAQAWNAANPRGQSTLWVAGRPFFAMSRSLGGRRAMLIQTPRIPEVEQALCAVVDSDGRVVFGRRDRTDRAAIRPAAESQLPWTLYVTAAPNRPGSGMPASQRFLLLGTAVMVLFLIAGTYFIARAIRREMEVSRMQSDFVSAVSHEFRSPLTSIRHLSEILELGRVPNEERRQVYYSTLVRETRRLQRLVEALLNFGRMEAGARSYRFEECEVAALMHRVAGEFDVELAAGRRLELSGPEQACAIDADPDALSVALRNVIDNAFKYSPDGPPVRVGWALENSRVAIQVRDQGLGITAEERRAIFRKFVRGSAAASANVKGSGVGLAMVRHIVAAHRGEIRVQSEPGSGSTFTILLPAVLPAAAPAMLHAGGNS